MLDKAYFMNEVQEGCKAWDDGTFYEGPFTWAKSLRMLGETLKDSDDEVTEILNRIMVGLRPISTMEDIDTWLEVGLLHLLSEQEDLTDEEFQKELDDFFRLYGMEATRRHYTALIKDAYHTDKTTESPCHKCGKICPPACAQFMRWRVLKGW